MSDIPKTTGTGEPSRTTGKPLGQFQNRPAQTGTGAKAQTTKPIPPNASPGKLPVITLLKRSVEVVEGITRNIHRGTDEEKKSYDDAEKTIKEISQQMQKAADAYSNEVNKALRLTGRARKIALDGAQNVLSRDMKKAFSQVELSGFQQAIQELAQDLDDISNEGKQAILEERIADAEKLYNLIVLTGCVVNEERLNQIHNYLTEIRNTLRDKGLDAAFESFVLGESYKGIIGAKGDIGQSMLKIMASNEKIEKIEGLEAFKATNEKYAFIFKWLTLQLASTVIGRIFSEIILAYYTEYYSSKGQEAGKKLEELLGEKSGVGTESGEKPSAQKGIANNIQVSEEKSLPFSEKLDRHINDALKEAKMAQQEIVGGEALEDAAFVKLQEENDEMAVRNKFCETLANSYISELEEGPQSKDRTFDKKLSQFLGKLEFEPTVDRFPGIKDQFLETVREKFADYYIIPKMKNLKSELDFRAFKATIHSIPDILFSPAQKQAIDKIKAESKAQEAYSRMKKILVNWDNRHYGQQIEAFPNAKELKEAMEYIVIDLEKKLTETQPLSFEYAHYVNDERKYTDLYEKRAKEMLAYFLGKNKDNLTKDIENLLLENPYKAIRDLGYQALNLI